MTPSHHIDQFKPYPAYKPSDAEWLGDLPEHWEMRPLKRVSTVVAGQSPSSELVSEYLGDFPFLQGNAEFGQMHPNARLACETPPKSARAGDILMSVRAPVGALNVADRDYAIGRGLCAVRTGPGLHRPFAYYALGVANQEFLRLSTGSTYGAVTVGIVGGLTLAFPLLPEQAAIVRYLDHVDRRIGRYVRAKEKLIALLVEQKHAVIHRAVTRGLDPNVRLKPSGIDWLGDVPMHWRTARAKFLFREVDVRSTTGREIHLSMSQKLGLVPSHMVEQSLISESYVGGKLCREGDLVLNRLNPKYICL